MSDLTYEMAVKFVQVLIDDAKEEMMRIRDRGRNATNEELLRFDSCRNFLMNNGRGVEDLLYGVRGIHVPSALKELERFATHGWKTAQREYHKNLVAA